MVPLHLLNKELSAKVVPLVFNTLAAPRPTAARCVALGRALRSLLKNRPERIALIATGGLSHDPGEKDHGRIDTAFDNEFIRRITSANVDALAAYTDGEIVGAGAGTAELLAWLCLAGIMAEKPARLIAYEPIVQWATGVGLVSYDVTAAA
jgi:aromatic ring-opening dioxygenase LigB subunit